MLYSTFKDKKISQLGFGTMRLPTKDGAIDIAQTQKMVDYAIASGINYFDTAWPYHGGESEKVIGKLLAKYPRESYYLATKYPGHQLRSSYDPREVFEKQLEKCQVEYFDFYLLHNVFEHSMATYLDPKWGILDYFKEQKRLGRIKHLGFSTHGSVETIKEFLDICEDDMEFCQIQLNYLDWTLQRANEKCELLAQHGIPIIVMEPVRGGKLANLSPAHEEKLKNLRPNASIASWAFKFLQGLPNIMTTLSGMSSFEQMQDNIATYGTKSPLSDDELATVFGIANALKKSVPCTACRYCTAECPMGLDIPWLLSIYNEVLYAPTTNAAMRVEFLPEEKKPTACLGCGKCSKMCPQNIDIPAAMQDMCDILGKIPSWAQVCKEREAAERENK